jgi:radical SAM superfamily enzyme YgiQ (UPF0313 family)
MDTQKYVSLGSNLDSNKNGRIRGKILLVKPPFFTPWTPPLGIAVLKAYLEQQGFGVRCLDFNTDSVLWNTHHKYFAAIEELEDISINDGYSKLWWILNAHSLAFINGADSGSIAKMLEVVIPLFGIRFDSKIIKSLLLIIERHFARLAELIDELDLSEYGVVGTSSYTTSLSSSLFMLRRVKEKYPRLKAVMGGGIFADDLALGSDNLTTLLEEYTFVDHVVLGEGEVLFHKLLTGELAHKRVISIADIEGKTLQMKEVPPPDFSDLNSEHYYHLTIEGARSCPFQCSFCSETVQWGDYRKKPMDLFADQVIGLAEKYKNNSFFMGDSLMNPYIFQFSAALLEKKANVLYDGYLRADKPVTWRDKVKVWARSGLYRTRLGIESAATRVLQSMDKMTTPQVISDVLKSLSNAGIRTTTYWIVGFGGETESDFQETCDFIKEHHRYIYELEAHPYYYYPYGQIGSRLHECFSLYPEEVVKLTKFKVWEVKDANPTREERYDRLRRISKLAADLGLPNIYTMAERYVAEERWQRLHPLAVEVYEGTRVCREDVRLPSPAMEIFSSHRGGGKPALCFEVSVREQIDVGKLSEAIREVIRQNDVLQLSVRDGKYVATPAKYEGLISSFDCRGKNEDEVSSTKRQAQDAISYGIAPEAGESVHVAVIRRDEALNEILFFAHSAIVDRRGATLLLEDLFRAYQQLSNDRPVTLLPAEKTYAEFIHESGHPPQEQDEIVEPQVEYRYAAREYSWDKATVDRMFSKPVAECDLSPAEVVIAAFLRVASQLDLEEEIFITCDYRTVDPKLKATAGRLVRAHQVPPEILGDADLFTDVREIGRTLRRCFREGAGAGAARSSRDLTARSRVHLNAEHFIEQPWLGGDSWAPKGFVEDGGIDGRYLLEVVPRITGDGASLLIKWRDAEDRKATAELIANNLACEIKAILNQCERFVAAKRFWLSEFVKDSCKPNLEIDNDEQSEILTGRGFVSIIADRPAVEKLRAGCAADVSTIILSAFSILLSRLNGREDLIVVAALDDGVTAKAVPLKLYPSWGASFKDYAREVARSVKQACEYSDYAFEVLTKVLPEARADKSCPVFDISYSFSETEPERIEKAMSAALEQYPAIKQPPDLSLVVDDDGDSISLRFNYDRGRLGKTIVEMMSSYLEFILQEAAGNATVQIGDITLGGGKASATVAESLSKDTFNF